MEGYPAQQEAYILQNRTTDGSGEHSPVPAVVDTNLMSYDEAIAERLASLKPRCLGYVHHTLPNGTTIPISQVIEGPNGEWVFAPLPVVPERYPCIKPSRSIIGQNFNLSFGITNLNITEFELEALTDILIQRRLCQNKQTAEKAAGPIR